MTDPANGPGNPGIDPAADRKPRIIDLTGEAKTRRPAIVVAKILPLTPHGQGVIVLYTEFFSRGRWQQKDIDMNLPLALLSEYTVGQVLELEVQAAQAVTDQEARAALDNLFGKDEAEEEPPRPRMGQAPQGVGAGLSAGQQEKLREFVGGTKSERELQLEAELAQERAKRLGNGSTGGN